MSAKIATPHRADPASRGFAAAVLAFLIWGGMPLYLHQLDGVPVLVIMAHRVVWSAVLVLGWLALRGQIGGLWQALSQPATRWRLASSAGLITVNWLTYVWAVGNGHVVEGSLGYFINPLVNVLLGVALLSERLNARQWGAVLLATLGVVWLTVLAGKLPWIALVLALSFGVYGFVRKTAPVDAVTGLAAETVLMAPFALACLGWHAAQGVEAMGSADTAQAFWLMAGGLITAVPLALFAYGAQKIPYSTIGLIQYIGPSLQLIIGLTVFGEAFPAERVVGFALIWLALIVYAGDGWHRSRRQRQRRALAPAAGLECH